ncbi:2TM domain-containing protein [Kaistella sp.]|uniref:2TM domain-containing protein n=1 Tax=Kaistella sp. TaxID=2782235 RepID=UPI002F9291FC
METNHPDNNIYREAKRKVKELKEFYIHFFVYIIVNLFLVARNVQGGDSLYDMDNYWTAILWGIGVLAHALSVFVPNFIFGTDWEKKKIRELMDKYK